MAKLSLLKDADLAGKTVFYRADYNVPMEDGKIKDAFRITSSFPTLDYLMDQGCRIIIGTHMGRPDGKEVPELSVRPLAQFVADHYPDAQVHVAHKLFDDQVISSIEGLRPGDILMLENLRYFPEEEGNDAEFGKKLAKLAEVYVNDAFSCDHRAHASIVGVPSHIPGYAGFVLQKEVENLGMLVKDPAHPFVVVMGGAKVSDKIEVIQALGKVADVLLIGGAMANTFLLAKGEDVSKSKVEEDKVDLAKELIDELGEKLVLAADYVAKDVDGGFSYLDIGPKAIEQFKGYLAEAKTVFWNGSLGYAEDPLYATATQEIAKYLGNLESVTSIVAGGDTVETITKLELHDQFTFVSTGGGAALELLGGKELPGVKVLER